MKKIAILTAVILCGCWARDARAQCEYTVKENDKYKLDTLEIMSDDNTSMFVYWTAMGRDFYLTVQCMTYKTLCVDTKDEQVMLETEDGERLYFTHFGKYNCESRATVKIRRAAAEFLAEQRVAALTLRGLRYGAGARLDFTEAAGDLVRDYFRCALEKTAP